MKLILAIVQDADVEFLMEDLVDHNFSVTKLSSTGGFLKSGNTTIIAGVEDDKVGKCLDIIESNCSSRTTTTTMMNMSNPSEAHTRIPIEISIGGATVFVLDVEEFYKI